MKNKFFFVEERIESSVISDNIFATRCIVTTIIDPISTTTTTTTTTITTITITITITTTQHNNNNNNHNNNKNNNK
jgi:hypothetical protein